MKDKRHHKIKSDYGIANYYDFYSRKYGVVDSKEKYKKIYREFVDGVIELMIEESLSFKLPYLNFILTIRKDKRRPRIENGKVINTTPPDWKTTLDLWEKDPEAKEKKIIVRHTNYHTSGYVFRIYFKKFNSKIRYKNFYSFNANRKFTRRLSARLLDEDKEKLNSFLLY